MESRWFRRAGPATAAIAALAALVAVTAATAVATATIRARATATLEWVGTPCPGAPAMRRATGGTWYQLSPALDATGALAGQTLTVGASDRRPARRLALAAESFATGPFGRVVLVGADDGRRSTLSLLDVAGGCAWSIGVERDVVRRATLTPAGDAVIEARVDRVTRADRGVWRRPLDGAPPRRILAPIAPDGRFGRTWTTALAWSSDGSSLAVQTCGEVACRTRLLDPATGHVRLIADPRLGELVGLSPDRLVVRGACRGLPCPIVSVRLRDGGTTILEPAAGKAVWSADASGRPAIVYESGASGGVLRAIGPDGHDARTLPAEGLDGADLRRIEEAIP
jgi:hypothetical protein